MAKKGESLADDGRVTVSPGEYPALLTRVYKDEKFPKPRNMIGLAKDLPVAEMEKLILANTRSATRTCACSASSAPRRSRPGCSTGAGAGRAGVRAVHPRR
jgi:hypothetical protein